MSIVVAKNEKNDKMNKQKERINKNKNDIKK